MSFVPLYCNCTAVKSIMEYFVAGFKRCFCKFGWLTLIFALGPYALAGADKGVADLPPPAIVPGASATNLVSENFMRAMIVDNMNPAIQSSAGIRDLVQSARLAGFDTLVVQVRTMGDAFYKTSVVPPAAGVGSAGGFDPLGELVKEARSGGRPIKVYGLFTALRVWKNSNGTPPSGHVVTTNPGWVSQGADGKKSVGSGEEIWLDPGVPDVQKHLTSVVSDLLKLYPLDGIAFDRLRAPDNSLGFGYAPEAVSAYNAANGKSGVPMPTDPAWIQWRRAQLDQLLGQLQTTVKTARPDCRVGVMAGAGGSAPVSREVWAAQSEPAAKQLQDWVSWCDRGLVDDCFLGNYKSTSAMADYLGWMRFATVNRGRARMITCCAGWMNSPEETSVMMLGAVVEPNAGGVALYCSEPLRERGYDNLMLKVLNPSVAAGIASSVSAKFAAFTSGAAPQTVMADIVREAGLNAQERPVVPNQPVKEQGAASKEQVKSPQSSENEDILAPNTLVAPPDVPAKKENKNLPPPVALESIPDISQIDRVEIPTAGAQQPPSLSGDANADMKNGVSDVVVPDDIAGRKRVSIPTNDSQLTNYNGEKVGDETLGYETPRFEAPKIKTVNDLGAYTDQGVPAPQASPVGRSRSKEAPASTGFRNYIDRPASSVYGSMPDPSVLNNAETITLKSGRTFNGKVVKRTPSEWTVRLPNGSEIRLQTSSIAPAGSVPAPAPSSTSPPASGAPKR